MYYSGNMMQEQEPPKKRYNLVLPDDNTPRANDVVEIITPFIMPSPFSVDSEAEKPKITLIRRKKIVPEVPEDFK